MTKIHELSENLTNQIAAGEVIERPASVVKELVENSIDAGASRIRIDFVDAGLKQVVVQDNGSGIASEQIDLAFMRHATSKINNERDLFKVATLGFRGEALASIAAVAHVEIVTASQGEIGSRAVFSGGVKKIQESSAAQKGTKITVKDLFFNTPARLKYLRSPRTEMMKIVDIVNRLALGYPHLAFTLSNNDKILMRTPGNGKLDQTVANVYGRHIAEKMLPIGIRNQDFKIEGLISKPELTRSTRNFISILLNGRYIKNFKLNTAILEGYGAKLTSRHYPIAVISIKVDPLLVDVNVHPTKQEVRLSKEKELGRLVTTAISDALVNKELQNDGLENLSTSRQESLVDQLQFNLNENVVDTSRKNEVPEVREEAQSALKAQKLEAQKSLSKYVDLTIPRQDKNYIITATWQKNVEKQTELTPFSKHKIDQQIISEGDETLSSNLPQLKYIGQSSNYLLAENNNDLYLLDQVAVRRRLAYEKIIEAFQTKKIPQQGLLTPAVLEFGSLDFTQIKDNLEEFKKIGIYLDDFGQNSFIARSYPIWIKGNIEERLRQILDSFLNLDHGKRDNFFARAAAAQAQKEVTGKIKLSNADASKLLIDLSTTSDPYHDANGNLTLIKIGQADLLKMFKKD